MEMYQYKHIHNLVLHTQTQSICVTETFLHGHYGLGRDPNGSWNKTLGTAAAETLFRPAVPSDVQNTKNIQQLFK